MWSGGLASPPPYFNSYNNVDASTRENEGGGGKEKNFIGHRDIGEMIVIFHRFI